jgi:hypothetical protein
MNNRAFTKEQISDLLKNPNVANCSPKVIGYRREFKVWAVKQYEEQGMTALQIFRQAGFDIPTIGHATADSRLRYWCKIYQAKGVAGLEKDRRGRPRRPNSGQPATKGSEADRIKRLEATVAYLRAENDFLIKLRGGKTE